MNYKALCLVFGLAVTTATNASEFQGEGYLELHLGQNNTSYTGGGLDYSYMTIGGAWGYQFEPNWSAELFMTFATDGDSVPDAVNPFTVDVDTKVNGIGGYLVARTNDDFYVKGKLGLIGTQFAYTAGGYEDEMEYNFGLSYGFSAGYDARDFYVELSYLILPEAEDSFYNGVNYDVETIALNVGFYY
ncbi:MAG: porin family protein [Gammaproteobacteria bacterium]|nr:porin family protein [Gammaproteobacteria bacterium]NVK89319.1 porin family protein [Gammaproteobacteria bacterium]